MKSGCSRLVKIKNGETQTFRYGHDIMRKVVMCSSIAPYTMVNASYASLRELRPGVSDKNEQLIIKWICDNNQLHFIIFCVSHFVIQYVASS